mgnify:CR=1 FL=1
MVARAHSAAEENPGNGFGHYGEDEQRGDHCPGWQAAVPAQQQPMTDRTRQVPDRTRCWRPDLHGRRAVRAGPEATG